jgi:hypothetical protein
MHRRLTALALVAGLLSASGCGHSGSGEQAALARYVARADAVELALRTPLSAVTRAGNLFAREQAAGAGRPLPGASAAHARALGQAAARVAALRVRLAAITAPAVAARLRALLLELIDGQLRLTGEVQRMVLYMPAFAAAATPLLPALRRLEPALDRRSAAGASAVAAAYREKAAALRRFAATLKPLLEAMSGLHPPVLLQAGYRAQLASIRGMRLNADLLAGALEGRRAAETQRILRAFDRAAAVPHSETVQKAEIAAVRAYDHQVRELERLAGAAQAERNRLAGSAP